MPVPTDVPALANPISELAQTGVSDLYRYLALSMTSDAADRHDSWRDARAGRASVGAD